MCRMLAELLEAEQPLFSTAIKQLEKASGHNNLDLQLLGNIIEAGHRKMRELGLDPNDTTGPELFHALIAQIKKHDQHLARKIGGSSTSSPTTLIPLIKAAVEKADVPMTCWVLKKSVARQMLHDNPPPAIMKHLRYRSIDQMLKKEDLFEIYGALRFAEGPEWLSKFNENYKHLKPSDFESRKIDIVVMPHDRWADLCEEFVHKKKHNITHLKEMGAILMLPVKQDKLPGITLWATSLLFHYINEIRLYSSFFKLEQVRSDFAEVFVDTLNADPGKHAQMVGNHIHWRVIQRYFGKLKDEHHPEIFQPHVQPEDLHWRRAEAAIAEIDPELTFWLDLDYVGRIYDGRPVTFNMLDVAASYTNKTPYEEREIYHFRESLWNEIFMRYMGQKNLERQILRQLDNDMIAPEKIKAEPMV